MIMKSKTYTGCIEKKWKGTRMLERKGKFSLIFLYTHFHFGVVITKILIINLEVFNPTCKPILSPDKGFPSVRMRTPVNIYGRRGD